jgi:hypothetical protein
MAHAYLRPIPEIFTDLIGQMTALVRKESQLARAEISEKATRALIGIVMIILGAVLLIPALVVLLQALIMAMIEGGMTPFAVALVAGGGTLVLGIILGLIGWNWIKPAALVPDKTIDQLKRDAAVPRHSAVTAHYGETGGARSDRIVAEETAYGEHRNRAA